eukprot:TRINITY_DN17051_c0_g1_i1.p3 TRINITY_DN17051_c0_g1~~TRINITY_DN17051_c0_g1_i1.p3  ORF type:complete len:155 (+),score=30.75 TRINITY_DN17051_c0_g1_i1:50-514(+)
MFVHIFMFLSDDLSFLSIFFFFFFKQKTAYEMLRSLVGSEMCIRDSQWHMAPPVREDYGAASVFRGPPAVMRECCVFFPSAGCDGEAQAHSLLPGLLLEAHWVILLAGVHLHAFAIVHAGGARLQALSLVALPTHREPGGVWWQLSGDAGINVV